MSTKRIFMGLILVFGILLLVTGFKNAPATSSTTSDNSITSNTSEITYQGVDGKNALELLQASHQVDVTTSGQGDFVNSIDGVTPDSNHFWSFYVNGTMSSVGASSYQTKSTDILTWKLDAISL